MMQKEIIFHSLRILIILRLQTALNPLHPLIAQTDRTYLQQTKMLHLRIILTMQIINPEILVLS